MTVAGPLTLLKIASLTKQVLVESLHGSNTATKVLQRMNIRGR